jgi:hypothetical protein
MRDQVLELLNNQPPVVIITNWIKYKMPHLDFVRLNNFIHALIFDGMFNDIYMQSVQNFKIEFNIVEVLNKNKNIICYK